MCDQLLFVFKILCFLVFGSLIIMYLDLFNIKFVKLLGCFVSNILSNLGSFQSLFLQNLFVPFSLPSPLALLQCVCWFA